MVAVRVEVPVDAGVFVDVDIGVTVGVFVDVPVDVTVGEGVTQGSPYSCVSVWSVVALLTHTAHT